MDFGNRKISNLCPFLKQPFPVEGNVQFLDFEFVQNKKKFTPIALGGRAHSFNHTRDKKNRIWYEIGNINQEQN